MSAIEPALSTGDLGRLVAFYTEVFGAEEVARVPGRKGPFFVTLGFDGASLTLVDHRPGAEAAPGRVVLAVFVENVDDLLSRVEAAGGTVHGKPRNMPWGHRVAHVDDPDGNPINLTQRL